MVGPHSALALYKLPFDKLAMQIQHVGQWVAARFRQRARRTLPGAGAAATQLKASDRRDIRLRRRRGIPKAAEGGDPEIRDDLPSGVDPAYCPLEAVIGVITPR